MNEKHQKVPDESRKRDQLGLTLELMDLPALAETFADSINQVFSTARRCESISASPGLTLRRKLRLRVVIQLVGWS